ncbi:LCP family protein [Streptomyces kronopolitis]|uniref:LCP family protein n=1 Tax=Streptomyces kronopolitis TaxID=1612435 RepID=UPI00369C20C3
MAGRRRRVPASTTGRRRRVPAGRTGRRVRWGRLIAVVVACLLVTGAALGYWVYDQAVNGVRTSDALGDKGPRSTGGTQNILLMGLDSRKDLNGNPLPKKILEQLHAGASSEVGGYNTNTLILLHIPGDGSRATGLSVPRDDLVDVPGFGKQKIKEAYGLAKAREEDRLAAQGVKDHAELESKGREAGRRTEIQTVRTFLGVPIDHFAEVNLAGFYDLAGALDGVDVCLKHPTKDKNSGADFPAGRQTLDARQSLAFVRQRMNLPKGDLDRTRRQQAFLLSAVHKLESSGTLDKIGRAYSLLDAAKRDIVIDKGWPLMDAADQMKKLAGGNVSFQTLKIRGFGTYRQQSVNLVDPPAVRRQVQELLRPAPSPRPSSPQGGGSKPAAPSPRPDSGDANSLGGDGVPCVD